MRSQQSLNQRVVNGRQLDAGRGGGRNRVVSAGEIEDRRVGEVAQVVAERLRSHRRIAFEDRGCGLEPVPGGPDAMDEADVHQHHPGQHQERANVRVPR